MIRTESQFNDVPDFIKCKTCVHAMITTTKISRNVFCTLLHRDTHTNSAPGNIVECNRFESVQNEPIK